MRRLDRTIELVGCGQDGWSDWDRVVRRRPGALSSTTTRIHIYTGSTDYWSNVLAPHQAERSLRICAALIERARQVQRIDRPIGIAYDEWNVWYREPAASNPAWRSSTPWPTRWRWRRT